MYLAAYMLSFMFLMDRQTYRMINYMYRQTDSRFPVFFFVLKAHENN